MKNRIQCRLLSMASILICCMSLVNGCTSQKSQDVPPSASQQTEVPVGSNSDSALELVEFEELYTALPERVYLPQSDNQAYPWYLDAAVVVPEGLDNADSLMVHQSEDVIHAEWASLLNEMTSTQEREHANTRDDAGKRFVYEDEAYAKVMSISEGTFRYRYAEKKIRDLNNEVERYTYEEKVDASNCGVSYEAARQMAESVLKGLIVPFECVPWRAGGRSPISKNMGEGNYVFLFSQKMNGIPIANPCEQGGEYEDQYIPEFMGARIIVEGKGITNVQVQGYEQIGTAEHIDKIISLDSACTLYRNFVADNSAAVDQYHRIMVDPYDRKVTYAVPATIDQINLCYVATMNEEGKLMLVPCWLFSCGSSNNGGFGVGFHAVTGEVVWLNTLNI